MVVTPAPNKMLHAQIALLEVIVSRHSLKQQVPQHLQLVKKASTALSALVGMDVILVLSEHMVQRKVLRALTNARLAQQNIIVLEKL